MYSHPQRLQEKIVKKHIGPVLFIFNGKIELWFCQVPIALAIGMKKNMNDRKRIPLMKLIINLPLPGEPSHISSLG